MVRVLFVCLGNICRSPLAEGAFAHLVQKANLAHRFTCDSAGTSNYHIGELPDVRARQVARDNGVVLPSRARQLSIEDFYTFDYILAMDRSNLRDIENLKARVAPDGTAQIRLLREFDPQKDDLLEVADPYYGTITDFVTCFTTVYRSSDSLLAYLQENH